MDLSQWEWTCACCGQRKRGVPHLGFDAPIHHSWAEQGDQDFKVLNKNSDTCTMEIDGQLCYFVRGVLFLPVLGAEDGFGFGVWSTLGEASFKRYVESISDHDQSRIGPLFGYLANRLPFYPDTLNLELDVLAQDGGKRPILRIRDEHEGHPLHKDQAEGLDADRFAELLSQIMPCDGRA